MSKHGDIRADLSGSASGFTSMLDKASAHAKRFGQQVSGDIGHSWTAGLARSMVGGVAGFVGLEGVKSFIEGIFERGKEIHELSEQFDISTDSVQRWTKAFDRAGLSQNLFFRTFEAMRAARQEMLEDPAKATKWRNLGMDIFRSALGANTTEQQLELYRQIAGSGAPRHTITEVLGRGGARVGAALPFLDASDPTFSKADLEEQHKIDSYFARQKLARQKWFVNGMSNIRGFFTDWDKWTMVASNAVDLVSVTTRTLLRHWDAPEILRTNNLLKDNPVNVLDDARDRIEKMEENLQEKRRAREDARAIKEEQDRQYYIKHAKEMEETAKVEREGEMRIEAIRRQRMPRGAQRTSIKAERERLEARLGDLQFEKDQFPLDKEQSEEYYALRERIESLNNEMREKPLPFSVDSMASSGLYVAQGSSAFSPLLGIQQQQLATLHVIAQNTATHKDPHKL